MSLEEYENVDELLLDVLYQACWDEKHKWIDNECISVYEDACYYLEMCGLLRKKNDRIFYLGGCK